MKKLFSAIIVLIFLACAPGVFLQSCAPQNDETVNVYVPDGAPALTVANLFSCDNVGGRKINVTVTTGNDVRAKVLSGEADAVICPTNMAAALYNSGVEFKLVSANLFGLLYLVGTNSVSNLADLKGQVVHSIGKNLTPEFVFKKILTNAGIEYVESDQAVSGKVAIKYYDKGSQIVPLLKNGVAAYAILGEPLVTKSGVSELFDLQELWKNATSLDESYPQAGLFVSEELLQDKKFMSALANLLNENTRYVRQNSETVAQTLTQNGSVDFDGVTFTQAIIDRCNIRYVPAAECKAQMTAYFEAIKTVNQSFALPNDGFYAELD